MLLLIDCYYFYDDILLFCACRFFQEECYVDANHFAIYGSVRIHSLMH